MSDNDSCISMNLRYLFHDFNPGKFLVFTCLLVFVFILSLRLDERIQWSYWAIFIPIWIWKIVVISGAAVGSYVWWKYPAYRVEGESYIHYKAMVMSVSLHLLLLMFELLLCDKLDSGHHLWILVFIPLIFISVISIAVCVWAVKHDRTFELELFCSVNIIQFIFLALRLDNFILWNWVIVFIPLWILMGVALIGVLYSVILAMILVRSVEILAEQRRGNLYNAMAYTCFVIPLFIFEILLVNKLDKNNNLSYFTVTLPLYVSLTTLICMAFGSRTGNHWWFGIRKDFCQFLLTTCPCIQEYGNVSYSIPRDVLCTFCDLSVDSSEDAAAGGQQAGGEGGAGSPTPTPQPAHRSYMPTTDTTRPAGKKYDKALHTKTQALIESNRGVRMPVETIEMPD